MKEEKWWGVLITYWKAFIFFLFVLFWGALVGHIKSVRVKSSKDPMPPPNPNPHHGIESLIYLGLCKSNQIFLHTKFINSALNMGFKIVFF